MNKLKLSIGSVPANISKVERFVEEIFDTFRVPEKLKGMIQLTIIEATNNAIVSGNRNDPQKLVKYTAAQCRQKITVTVEDEGQGFDYSNVPDPVSSPGAMGGAGRGIYLMSKLSDELKFTKNGSKVTMTYYTEEEV